MESLDGITLKIIINKNYEAYEEGNLRLPKLKHFF